MSKFVIRSSISPYQVAMSAPAVLSTTRYVLAAGIWGPVVKRPTCLDCRDFEAVVTRNGVVTCPNTVHSEAKPPLPLRPQPHERDGRQPAPEPARPHAHNAALLAG
ncbi:hypothetical protein [Streptomyces natalensis]|uniref:hypothetical protein n=1 Tax=Streptomyces natalensis TaxID=68242 RepID=UPI00069B8E7B|nr:hypothetical protein [Streptomyces natalensis]